MSGTHLDIVVATETWLKSYHSNKSVELSVFDVIRNDRYAKRSGGVIMYIRKSLNFKVLKLSDKVSSEFLFVEVIFPDSKILVGAYYKAPKVIELDVLKDVLLELSVLYDDILLLGDFNENHLGAVNGTCSFCVNHTCSKCEFANVIDQFGLKSMGSIPSHYPIGERPSLIDLCLTNKPEKVIFFNQLSHGLSKHDLIFGSYSCNKGVTGKKAHRTRNFTRIDKDQLYHDACAVDWNDIFGTPNVSDKVDLFNLKILSLLDAHAPLRLVSANSSYLQLNHGLIMRLVVRC